MSEGMLHVNVALPSGRSQDMSVPSSSKVGDLSILAQKHFGYRFVRLVTAEGRSLSDPTESLQDARVRDADSLTALVLQPKVVGTASAFALWCSGGDGVVTWGKPSDGGDSSSVQDRLKSVVQVVATESAFAAILADGSVVTWGDPLAGGDSSSVQEELRNVQQVQASERAFAATLADGSVVTWGPPEYGGDSSAVDPLVGVRQVQATERAFAAILADGSVVRGAIQIMAATAPMFSASLTLCG